jgi:PAS domain-containing serine/threonine kinase
MDLFECIEKFESFTEPAARHIFSQIVEAVSHLHDIGLVHRDIKDENILIDDKFHVKLIDFGSAAFFDPTGQRKFDMFLGTKQYAAPEILLQKEYLGPEAEVWALGCCLYIILTGAVPFSSQKQAIEHPFTTPTRPLSPSCLNLLSRMLDKSADYRATLKEIKNHPWLSMNSTASFL